MTMSDAAPGTSAPDAHLHPQDLVVLAALSQANDWTRAVLCNLARRGAAMRRGEPERARVLLDILGPWPLFKAAQFLFDLMEWEDFMVDGEPPPLLPLDRTAVLDLPLSLVRAVARASLDGLPGGWEPVKHAATAFEASLDRLATTARSVLAPNNDTSAATPELPELESGFYLCRDVVLGALGAAGPLLPARLTSGRPPAPDDPAPTQDASHTPSTEQPALTLTCSGGPAAAVAGSEFPAMSVTARDTAGNPFAGLPVRFDITGSTGSAFSDGAVSSTATTGPDGLASTLRITAGPTPGDFTVQATAPGDSSVTGDFTVRAAPAALQSESGNVLRDANQLYVFQVTQGALFTPGAPAWPQAEPGGDSLICLGICSKQNLPVHIADLRQRITAPSGFVFTHVAQYACFMEFAGWDQVQPKTSLSFRLEEGGTVLVVTGGLKVPASGSDKPFLGWGLHVKATMDAVPGPSSPGKAEFGQTDPVTLSGEILPTKNV